MVHAWDKSKALAEAFGVLPAAGAAAVGDTTPQLYPDAGAGEHSGTDACLALFT